MGKITQFRGKIAHKEVHKLSSQADIGIIMRDPRIPTLLSVSCVEYMAMEMPVIVNDYSELGKFVKETKAGYIVDTPNDLLALLPKLIKNKKELVKIGQKNRLWIEKNNDKKIIAKELNKKIVSRII